jgi:hypothetical protein
MNSILTLDVEKRLSGAHCDQLVCLRSLTTSFAAPNTTTFFIFGISPDNTTRARSAYRREACHALTQVGLHTHR